MKQLVWEFKMMFIYSVISKFSLFFRITVTHSKQRTQLLLQTVVSCFNISTTTQKIEENILLQGAVTYRARSHSNQSYTSVRYPPPFCYTSGDLNVNLLPHLFQKQGKVKGLLTLTALPLGRFKHQAKG